MAPFPRSVGRSLGGDLVGRIFRGRETFEVFFCFVNPTTCHICDGIADMVVGWISLVWYPSTCPIRNVVADRMVGWILSGLSSFVFHLPFLKTHFVDLFLMCGDLGFLFGGKVGGCCISIFVFRF